MSDVSDRRELELLEALDAAGDERAELDALERLDTFYTERKKFAMSPTDRFVQALHDFPAGVIRSTAGFAAGALEGVGQAGDIGANVVQGKPAMTPGPAQQALGQPAAMLNEALGPPTGSLPELAGSMAGGGGMAGVARKASGMAPTLAGALKAEASPTIGAFAGGAAAQTVAPDSQMLQLLSMLVGGGVGAATPGAVGGKVRGGLIGDRAAQQRATRLVADNESIGLPTSIAEASSRAGVKQAQSVIQRLPGNASKQSSVKMQQGAEQALQRFTQAGELDEVAIGAVMRQGFDNFIDNGSERFRSAFKQYDAIVPPTAAVSMDNTQRVLANIMDALKSGPKGKELVKKLGNKVDSLAEILSSGELNFAQLRYVRTKLGTWLRNKPVLLDMDKGQVKLLYGAITDDMYTAVRRYGGKRAAADFKKLGREYKAFAENTREITGLMRKDGEKMFQAVFGTANSQVPSTKQVRTVLASMDGSKREQVSSAFLYRMGQANPSEDMLFSVHSFVTRWNKAFSNNPSLRESIFATPRLRTYERDMQKLVRGLTEVRESAAVLANPSRTSESIFAMSAVWGGLTGLLTGRLDAALLPAGLLGVTNVASRLVTFQPFVRWAAKATADRPERFPGHVARLQAQYVNDPEWSDAVNQFANDALQQYATLTGASE